MRIVQQDEMYDNWESWISKLSETMSLVLWDEYVFRMSMASIEKEGVVDPSNLVYQWLQNVYGRALFVGIRRLVEGGPDTYSVKVLLEKMIQHRAVLSRDRYVDAWPDILKHAGEEYWDENLAGDDGLVSTTWLEKQLEKIEAVRNLVMPAVNKYIAHYERGDPQVDWPKWIELHEAVFAIRDVVGACDMLLRQNDSSYFPYSDQIHQDLKQIWGAIPDEIEGY